MKFFYVANIRLPTEKAHGIQIMKTCEALARLGVALTLVVPVRGNSRFHPDEIFSHYGIAHRFAIRFIPCPDPVALLRAPQGWYIKLQAFFFSIALLPFLFRQKKENPGAYWYCRDEYMLPILQRLSNRVIWEAHNLPRHPGWYRSAWHRCHALVTISQGLQRDLIASVPLLRGKITVCPDGVDENFFTIYAQKDDLRRALHLPLDKKIILYSGHLYPWKGVSTLVDAVEKLDDQTELFLVGGTEYDYRMLLRTRAPHPRAHWLGSFSHAYIPRYLQAADILALPTSARYPIGNTYTSPLKLFEYMASGVPILATSVPSHREILDDTCAYFFEPDNPSSFASVARHIFADRVRAQTKATHARTSARRYTWHARASTLASLCT